MTEDRYGSAGAHHKDLGFLITGGVYDISTTEITTDGITFNAFTPLPLGLHSHCLVALDGDDGEFFVTAGHSSGCGVCQRTFIHKIDQWNEMESRPTGGNGNGN